MLQPLVPFRDIPPQNPHQMPTPNQCPEGMNRRRELLPTQTSDVAGNNQGFYLTIHTRNGIPNIALVPVTPFRGIDIALRLGQPQEFIEFEQGRLNDYRPIQRVL